MAVRQPVHQVLLVILAVLDLLRVASHRVAAALVRLDILEQVGVVGVRIPLQVALVVAVVVVIKVPLIL
jgi:hypothetical protein